MLHGRGWPCMCAVLGGVGPLMSFLRAGILFEPLSCFFFFFSSRRRHTRCLSDWSSDVCSSDLCTLLAVLAPVAAAAPASTSAKHGFFVVRGAAGDGGVGGRPVATIVVKGFVLDRKSVV